MELIIQIKEKLMELTKKKALELSIELWTWLAETGKQKWDWPEWDKYGGYDNISCGCFLCEYEMQHDNYICGTCPLVEYYGDCGNTYLKNWSHAENNKTRKKYAKLFLKQLKDIKLKDFKRDSKGRFCK